MSSVTLKWVLHTTLWLLGTDILKLRAQNKNCHSRPIVVCLQNLWIFPWFIKCLWKTTLIMSFISRVAFGNTKPRFNHLFPVSLCPNSSPSNNGAESLIYWLEKLAGTFLPFDRFSWLNVDWERMNQGSFLGDARKVCNVDIEQTLRTY